MPPDLRIGCSSWTSEAWWDRLYPRTLREAERLPHYARLYNTVEVDSTYYHIPARGMVQGWRARTPKDFLFTLKMTRDLLDPKGPVDREGISKFVASAQGLGEKLGPILLQFPPWFKPGRASEFFGELLDALDPGPRYAVELRDAGWFQGELFEGLLRDLSDRGMILTWAYLTYLDVPAKVTSDQLYLRFIGDHTTVPAEVHGEVRVDRSKEVELWSGRVRAEEERVQRVFVFFNNHFAGFAPESVNLFRRAMSLPSVDYAPHDPQQKLAG